MREGAGVFIGHRWWAAWHTQQGRLQPVSDSRRGGASAANTELGWAEVAGMRG
jgi:hypothetical protein